MSLCVCTSASRGEEHRRRSVHTLQVQTCLSMASGGLAHGRGWQRAGVPGQNQGEKAQKRTEAGDDNLGLSLLGSEEETDSDNRAFLYLYETTLPCVERQNREEG
jgi:hypothetical protein